MRPPMFQTAFKQNYTRNAYGDFSTTTETELICHFRRRDDQVSGTGNETIQSDAMAWFEPDSGVQKEDILKINGEFYRVERIIEARKLRDPELQFIKTELLRYGTIS